MRRSGIMVVLRARAARDCRKGVLAKRSSKQSPLIAPRGSISERSKRDCAHRSNHDDSYLNERAFIVRFNHDDYHNLPAAPSKAGPRRPKGGPRKAWRCPGAHLYRSRLDRDQPRAASSWLRARASMISPTLWAKCSSTSSPSSTPI